MNRERGNDIQRSQPRVRGHAVQLPGCGSHWLLLLARSCQYTLPSCIQAFISLLAYMLAAVLPDHVVSDDMSLAACACFWSTICRSRAARDRKRALHAATSIYRQPVIQVASDRAAPYCDRRDRIGSDEIDEQASEANESTMITSRRSGHRTVPFSGSPAKLTKDTTITATESISFAIFF